MRRQIRPRVAGTSRATEKMKRVTV